MKVYQDLLRASASQPMRLCSTGEGNAIWHKVVLLCVFDVGRRRRPAVDIAVLGEVEVSQIGTKGGKHDIFVVVVGAIVAFEG